MKLKTKKKCKTTAERKKFMFLPVFNEKAQKGLTCGVIGNTSDFGSEES